MFVVQSGMFASQGLKVRRNPLGFTVYALFYSVILQPACLWGYVTELVRQPKTWGTK
jgi:biofilm PGA synthesis N-glycosyltransferase PgaC